MSLELILIGLCCLLLSLSIFLGWKLYQFSVIIMDMEDAVEELTAAPAKSGVTTGLLNLVDIPEEERTALRERDEANQETLKNYADRIDEINKLLPQQRQPELEKLYNEIKTILKIE